MDDKTIIAHWQDGQTQLLGILIDRYHNSLIRFCYYLTGNKDTSADLYQETWERVLMNISRYDSQRPFGNWLFAIATNIYRDNFRKRKRWLNIVKDYFHLDQLVKVMESAPGDPGPEEQLSTQEDKEALRNCLLELDDNHRLPLVLFYFRDTSIEDVAEILSIPVGTVKSRLHNAKLDIQLETADIITYKWSVIWWKWQCLGSANIMRIQRPTIMRFGLDGTLLPERSLPYGPRDGISITPGRLAWDFW